MTSAPDLPTLVLTLHEPPFAGRTGRNVLVAVIDSGAHPGHPHLPALTDGVGIAADGSEHGDYLDRLGHGTAVTAAIAEKAPDAGLLAVKVFDTSLRASALALATAIDSASARGARLINLSLGTTRPTHAEGLRAAVDRATARGAIIVAAGEHEGHRWLPGCLDGVLSVALNGQCERDAVRVRTDGATMTFEASGLPRPIPGIPPARNLHGLSFAVANVTGFLARFVEDQSDVRTADDLTRALAPWLSGTEAAPPGA